MSPLPDVMTTEYPKIPALHKRSSEGDRPILPGVYRSGAFDYLMDNLWWWTEKLDGTNVRIQWDGHCITFAGRTDKAQLHTMAGGALHAHLIERYCTDEFEALMEQTFGEKEVTLYGEGIGAKIQKGGGDYGETRFVGFDVRVGDCWLGPGEVEAVLCLSLGVPHVPRYFSGPKTLREAIDYGRQTGAYVSDFRKGLAEGIVGCPVYPVRQPSGGRIQVKLKAHELG